MTVETAPPRLRAILVGVLLPEVDEAENEASLIELARLVKTLGYEVVRTTSQRRSSLSSPTVVGDGKLKEIARWTGGTGVVPKRKVPKRTKAALKFATAADEEPTVDTDETEDAEPLEDVSALIFDCELTPSQMANLDKACGIRVLDRTGVIVEIFSRHARTREARLQVEIARLKYLAPRMRQTGRGPEDRMGKAGESSLELDRRKIRDRIAELRDEIALVQREQSEGRSQRAREHCVALVGYTNAGKSSLMRALTSSEVLVEDKLFATLDTTVRTLAPASLPPILISDTVGFIKKLPHDLVASFRSTLEEASNASLLLFVADASDASFRSQLQVTREVLASIGVTDIPSRLVLNKCDKLQPRDMEALRDEFPEAFLMSAKAAVDVKLLREMLIEFFEQGMVDAEVFISYERQKAAGALRREIRVLSERHDDSGTHLRVRADKTLLATLKKRLESRYMQRLNCFAILLLVAILSQTAWALPFNRERFNKCDASVDRLMAAYNAGDAQAFLAEFSPGQLQLVNAQARIKTWRAKVGAYRSRKLNVAASHVSEARANYAYDVVTEKGNYQLWVHFSDYRGSDMLEDADFRTVNGMMIH